MIFKNNTYKQLIKWNNANIWQCDRYADNIDCDFNDLQSNTSDWGVFTAMSIESKSLGVEMNLQNATVVK